MPLAASSRILFCGTGFVISAIWRIVVQTLNGGYFTIEGDPLLYTRRETLSRTDRFSLR